MRLLNSLTCISKEQNDYQYFPNFLWIASCFFLKILPNSEKMAISLQCCQLFIIFSISVIKFYFTQKEFENFKILKVIKNFYEFEDVYWRIMLLKVWTINRMYYFILLLLLSCCYLKLFVTKSHYQSFLFDFNRFISFVIYFK